jgi:hypothetical protein
MAEVDETAVFVDLVIEVPDLGVRNDESWRQSEKFTKLF